MNVLRCVAIISIVWGHCLNNIEGQLFTQPIAKLIQVVMLEAGRVGTVIFFIISGYFLSDKLEKFTCLTYIKYRFSTLIVPWIISLSALVSLQLIHIMLNSKNEINGVLGIIINLYKGCIFHAAFWFIPVAVFSAMVLVAFKSISRKFWFGLTLLLITLFYCVNLYFGWVSVNHTRAFAGYIFLMWLGLQFKLYAHIIAGRLTNLNCWLVMALFGVFFLIACFEGYYLKALGCKDPFASIRFTNIILSVVLFMLVLKSNRMTWFNYFKPQQTVFGVYLIHCMVITEAIPWLNHLAKYWAHTPVIFILLLTNVLDFIIIITASFILVVYVRKFKIRLIKLPSLSRLKIYTVCKPAIEAVRYHANNLIIFSFCNFCLHIKPSSEYLIAFVSKLVTACWINFRSRMTVVSPPIFSLLKYCPGLSRVFIASIISLCTSRKSNSFNTGWFFPDSIHYTDRKSFKIDVRSVTDARILNK